MAWCLCSTALCPSASSTQSLQEDSPRPAAADERAKAKQHLELTALHLASALKEVINSNNHPGAAAGLGGEQGWSAAADAGQGMVPPPPGAATAKNAKLMQRTLENERKGGCRQSLGSFPPHQAPGRFFRRD